MTAKTTKKTSRNPKREAQNSTFSVSPNGEAFPLPKPEDYEKELARLESLVAFQRRKKREIVVVMGVGFVGAVMAGVVVLFNRLLWRPMYEYARRRLTFG